MARLFLECAIRAALIVAGTAIVLYALRVNAARIKHRVWTSVVLLMLLLPVWTAWGPKAPVRFLPAFTPRTENQALAPTTAIPSFALHPDTALEISQPAARTPVSKLPALLLGIYLLGLFSFLFRLAFGTAAAHKFIQQATLRNGRFTSASCAVPVTVGWFHPTVILPEGWQQWPQTQLDVVLTHECEHAQRRDPLVQWLALLNRAVFWFHPAAWWLERELSSLAEEACDGAVLACGYDARDYAETLMDMARAIIRSGTRVNVLGVAMPGASLPQRIRRIIENVPAPHISRTRIACLVATCTITCVAFAAGRLERGQARASQSPTVPQWQTAAGGKQTFDVASVKQNRSGPPPSGDPPRSNVGLTFGDDYSPNGGRLSVTNFPLSFFLGFAYKLTPYQTLSLQSQLPKWAITESFDIEAKAGSNPTKDQMRLMMQSLLVDRFKLAIHNETRQVPVFALVLARSGKTGPQLQPYSGNPPCYTGPPPGAPGLSPEASAKAASGFTASCGALIGLPSSVPGRMRRGGRNMNMDEVAGFLTVTPGNPLDRPVLNRTGLNGNFDFTIEYTPEFNGPTPPNFQADPTGPTFLEALQEQLGLKLQPQTGPVDVLVIDHIEEPSPN